MTKKTKVLSSTKSRKVDYEANNALIRAAFIALLKENKGQRPTVAQIAEATGLHINTVKKHVKGMNFQDIANTAGTWKILTDDVALAIFKAATVKLNPSAQKLWFQLIEGWSERTDNHHSGKIETTPPAPPVILKITGPTERDS